MNHALGLMLLASAVSFTPLCQAQDPNQNYVQPGQVVTLSADDLRLMANRNIAQITQAISLMASDLGRMTSGSGSAPLAEISNTLKNLADSAANAGAGIESARLSEISANLADQARTPLSAGSEYQSLDSMFKAHSALLAGNIASLAATINTASQSGQSQFNVTQGQARDFVDRSAAILRSTQAYSTYGTRSSNSGMIGASDTWRSDQPRTERYRQDRSTERMYGAASSSGGSSAATSGLGSARDASGGQIGTYADSSVGRGPCRNDYSESKTAQTSAVHNGDQGYRTSRSGMIGASMADTRFTDVSIHDMAILMRNMGSVMENNNRDVLFELASITDNLAVLHDQAAGTVRGTSFQSPSTNIGSRDAYIGSTDVTGSEYDTDRVSGRTNTGLGAGTGTVDASRNYNRGSNTAGTSTGTGSELSTRDWDE